MTFNTLNFKHTQKWAYSQYKGIFPKKGSIRTNQIFKKTLKILAAMTHFFFWEKKWKFKQYSSTNNFQSLWFFLTTVLNRKYTKMYNQIILLIHRGRIILSYYTKCSWHGKNGSYLFVFFYTVLMTKLCTLHIRNLNYFIVGHDNVLKAEYVSCCGLFLVIPSSDRLKCHIALCSGSVSEDPPTYFTPDIVKRQ